MSDQIVELKHLRGTQAQKDVSSRVPAEAQIAVVTDEQYAVLGDGVTAISALRPMEDRRVQTGDHTATETVTDVGASIIAIDTTTDAGTVQLPTLSANIGRRIYIININAGNSITINAEGSDTIGAAGDTSIEVGADVTTTIMVGTATYWEQVATGGGTIVEKGTNSNGSYVVFSSGIQVCFGNATIDAYPDVITLPQAFVNTEYILLPASYNDSVGIAGRTANERDPSAARTVSSFQVYIYNTVSNSQEASGDLAFIAIGESA